MRPASFRPRRGGLRSRSRQRRRAAGDRGIGLSTQGAAPLAHSPPLRQGAGMAESGDSLLRIAARDLERLTQVTATLVRHGFGALVGRAHEAGADATRTPAVR